MRWPVLRWVLRLALSLHVATVAAAPAMSEDVKTQIIAALDAALGEEDASKIVEPYMGELKQLPSQVVEKVVLRQWWVLARSIVAKSHEQQVDLSFAVRKSVRALKDEADELLRTLNPKYGQAQQVSPAFQWAQNDTCVFLTVKFTVRWNAPGALEVKEPAVQMEANTFNFTGLGQHSNNKYKYILSLSLFDNILPATSSWSLASVGKLSVTLKKRWARKWPRLLANKKQKIGNMHIWMEQQDKLDSALGGMSTVSNSPVTCAAGEKMYCLATDTCKKAANCSQCPGKSIPLESENMCTGMPTEKASLSFKDADMDEHEIGGPISITKARNEFDIDRYAVYWGKNDRDKLELEDGSAALVGEAVPTGSDTEVHLKHNTKVPEQATHLLVFSKNAHGEYATPGNIIVKDAYLPREKPKGLVFDDEDGDKNEVGGTVTVTRASDEATINEYALHWGKSPTKKIAASSFIRDIPKGGKSQDGTATYYVSRSTKIPEAATHLLVFSKNDHGDNPSPVALKVVDHLKPCLSAADDDCPAGVTVKGSQPEVFSVQRAKSEATVTTYVLYFGRQSCSLTEATPKNGHMKDLAVDGSLDYELTADTPVPEGTTHVLVFSKNSYGESELCVSVEFTPPQAQDKGKKEL
jgi:hypothetical protein